MDKNIQQEKAKKFLSLHKGEKILILPNIWDPLGARILEAEGFPAAATASAAISSSLGCHDHEMIKFSTHLEIIKRIAGSVEIPVSADIESGYAGNISELKSSIAQVLQTGIAGINIEDNINEGAAIRELHEQCERISVVRETAANAGIDLVVNARIDYFLVNPGKSKEEIADEIIKRSKAYTDAGADCIYPIGITDRNTLILIRKNISSPINVLGTPQSESLSSLQKIGINRVSFGPYIFRSAMKKFLNIINELKNFGSYKCFSEDFIDRNEMQKYLRNNKE
jgi:2-methylisocitrate lyase-like PEP mutase family enzyme